ncbi:PTS glucose transporter subunit IIA [Alicyclobacillus contaminans]|uniref:PTS sugar transporter subunit IIA n=1 Tax=Alicyclobacillus contaminans TaxID=392016 RepID=UPI0004293905|nr:PTS glucose transporter subunit IIA [Alicyclobacillus contaminans]GMA50056.1 PTS glucose transporter subunit IIA [Alicyclobacillus contaminans]
MVFWKRKTDTVETTDGGWLTLLAPLSGRVVRLEDVPDPVFAQRMVGDGAAIDPTSDTVVSPMDGTLTNLFPTAHAAGVTAASGLEVLVHVGVDTVELKGQGFTPEASQGQTVTVGTPLIRLDLETLRNTAKSVITPVVVTNPALVETLEVTQQDVVEAGRDWLLRVKLRRA